MDEMNFWNPKFFVALGFPTCGFLISGGLWTPKGTHRRSVRISSVLLVFSKNVSCRLSAGHTHFRVCHRDHGDTLHRTEVVVHFRYRYYRKGSRFIWPGSPIWVKLNPQVHSVQQQILPNFIQIGGHLGETCFRLTIDGALAY